MRLTRVLGRKPIGRPGLYRRLREDYFERVEAIEFTVAHDDGRNTHELDKAEIVLVGVSRVGKTPLSIYLSVMGWKVANVPLVPKVPPPEILFEMDHHRVVGLTIDPGHLIVHRRTRGRRIGADPSAYADDAVLKEELDLARRLFRRGRFRIVDVTHKSIEESAEEVLQLVGRGHERKEG